MSDVPLEPQSTRVDMHDVTWDDERVTRFWDFMSQTSSGEYFSSKHAQEIASEILRRISPVGIVADVGCGGGHLLRALMDRGIDIVGVDSSPTSIEWAREQLPDAPIEALQVGSMTALPLADESVDTVALIEVVEHALDWDLDRIFSEARRVLRRGGHIFITTRNAEDLAREMVMCPDCGAVFHRMQHVRSWSPLTLSHALTVAGFEAVTCRALRFVGPSGFVERNMRRLYYRLTDRRPDLIAVARRPTSPDTAETGPRSDG